MRLSSALVHAFWPRLALSDHGCRCKHIATPQWWNVFTCSRAMVISNLPTSWSPFALFASIGIFAPAEPVRVYKVVWRSNTTMTDHSTFGLRALSPNTSPSVVSLSLDRRRMTNLCFHNHSRLGSPVAQSRKAKVRLTETTQQNGSCHVHTHVVDTSSIGLE
jgi:hypothetical protein